MSQTTTAEQLVVARRDNDAPNFSIRREEDRVRASGELTMRQAATVWRQVRAASAHPSAGGALDLDLSNVTFIDGAIAALLVAIRSELSDRGNRCRIVGATGRVARLIDLYGGFRPPVARVEAHHSSAVGRVGIATLGAIQGLSRWVAFVGSIAAGIGGAVVRPVTANISAVVPLVERGGADGVLIVLLLNFLVGFVMGYQSAHQLQLYGANIFVADVVGISVTRELAPLMTAIIMSGRSGASYAAELGTMKVSEEIDALRTLGFDPARYLVLPRVIALALVAAPLTLCGMVVGVFGGAIVGVMSLGVGMRGYLAELQTAVFFADVFAGLTKSVAFAIAIGLIGCQQGLATMGGAAGVGRRTTSTVVICLFTIVIIDTLFTLLFRSIGL
ncbi:MAG: MlaE family lipid ABC transporter permease subunit [Polyangiaceae bacterium]|nr:MlaE family lipid ABC transporter permease subunit [Polyangiaceae bacterium]